MQLRLDCKRRGYLKRSTLIAEKGRDGPWAPLGSSGLGDRASAKRNEGGLRYILQMQDTFSIQVTNLLLVLFGDLQMAQPVSSGAIRLIRPVN